MCEARNDLAQPMKINALKGILIEALPHRFPSFTAMYQRAKVPVPVSPQSSGSDQKLGSQAVPLSYVKARVRSVFRFSQETT